MPSYAARVENALGVDKCFKAEYTGGSGGPRHFRVNDKDESTAWVWDFTANEGAGGYRRFAFDRVILGTIVLAKLGANFPDDIGTDFCDGCDAPKEWCQCDILELFG